MTLAGWSPWAFRLWYVTGALMGGAPLAQGSVYFHLPRRAADRMTAALVPYLALATLLVVIAPLDPSRVEAHRLTGRVFAWPWVRALSPLVNLYALVFLVGGAARSAWRAARGNAPARFASGNALIAVGALLPGIGGTFSRLGMTEVLYVLECVGLAMIWRGYALCVAEPAAAELPAAASVPAA